MALNGDLAENPVYEVLSLMAGKTGVLRLRQISGLPRLDLHFDAGVLCALLEDDQLVRRLEAVTLKLLTATMAGRGTFEFVTANALSLQHRNKISSQGLALDLATRSDHLLAGKDGYPSAAQIFRWSGNPMSAKGRGAELDFFIDETVDLLGFGADAQRIAGTLQLSVLLVRSLLGELLSLGAIAALSRDKLWSKLDSTIEARSATPLRLIRPDGSKLTARVPDVPLARPMSEAQKLSTAGQKIVPVLRRQPVNKPFPQESEGEGK